MICTIEIIDDLMCVMDDDGNGYDAATLTSYRDAKQQIRDGEAAGDGEPDEGEKRDGDGRAHGQVPPRKTEPI